MFIHQLFRRICKDILKFNPFDLSLILEMLGKYVYIYLSYNKSEYKNKFYLNEDLKVLSQALEKITLIQELPPIIQGSKIALILEDENLLKKV